MMKQSRTLYGMAALAALAACVPGEAAAQAAAAGHAMHAGSPAITQALVRDVSQVEQKLTSLAEAIPEAKYDWRPGEGVRSVGEVFMHVAADNYLIPSFAGVAAPAATGIKSGEYPTAKAFESRKATKAEAVQAMRESLAHLRKAIGEADQASLERSLKVFGMDMTGLDLWVLATTHLHEHLGQMIAYARSNGVVPPWSK